MEIVFDNSYLFIVCIAVIAFFYGAVGHGGATGYLALMAIFNFSPIVMKPTALVLNLVVSSIAFYHFYQSGSFKSKLFIPFAVSSIPFSFIGGYIDLDPAIYKNILAVLLLLSIIKLIPFGNKKTNANQQPPLINGLIVGAIIGFFSGLIGIGGGIILSPIIVLFNWGNIKEAAAVAALFIFVNSAAGISGQLLNGISLSPNILYLIVTVVVGGFLGSYFGSKKANNSVLKILLCTVLLFAGIKLLLV